MNGARLSLNLDDLAVIDRAEKACDALIELAKPRGRLASAKCCGNLRGRAKWLRNEIEKLKAELSDANPAL